MATPPETDVSSAFPFDQHKVEVLGSTMAYVDTDPSGVTSSTKPTVIFLHGNPTSSYLWRNVIPHISPLTRCIAPDNIGMGASAKPAIKYTFADHARYLESFLATVLPTSQIIFVIQDWGSALGFDWAHRHPSRVAGLVFMEFIRPFTSFADFAPQPSAAATFKAFRTPETGRPMLIDQNAFIEVMLPRGMLRTLAPEEMEVWRAPYRDPPSREPLYMWPNEIPIEGEPADVHARVSAYHSWLVGAENAVPKLFFWATPGRVVREEQARWYVERLRNCKAVFVGQGTHFLMEDHPRRIGEETALWLGSILG